MEFVTAIKSGFQNYVNFSGRSTRPAFWYWTLFQILVSVVISFVEGGGHTEMVNGAMSSTYSPGILGSIWSLATLLPGIGVAIRRLHDADKSGWRLFWVFLPLVGWIMLIVWYCEKGTAGANRFGPQTDFTSKV